MAKSVRKLAYNVGDVHTVGKPTMVKHGLGRQVILTATDEKRVTVQDVVNPELTAVLKYANLGNIFVDGREFDPVTNKFTPVKKAKASSVPPTVAEALAAVKEYEAQVGDVVSGGKARRMTALRNKLTEALATAGLTLEQVS